VTRTADHRDVAQVLERIAAYLELKGTDGHRIRAFRASARALDGLPKPLREALEDGTLEATTGIGPGTVQVVRDVVETGQSSLLEELREEIPPGLVEMLAISGLGPAKIRLIHDTLDIDSLPELEAAAHDGRLAGLPHFGEKTARNILKGIANLRKAEQHRLLHHAVEEARHLTAALERIPGVLATHVAGDTRRCMELVEDLVIVLVADVPPADVFERVAELPGVIEYAGRDERVVTLRFAGGTTAQVVVTTPVNVGTVLIQATGSRAHIEELTGHARALGYTLHGAALWQDSTFVATPNEAAVYAALGLDAIPPELREGRGEIAAAAAHTLPRLVRREDLAGVLHCHSSMSDGSSSIETMARAAGAAGYQYIGITDHSQSATLAGGLTPDMILEQGQEIDELNERLEDIQILKGIEADILIDGSLDYDPKILARLDFVIGSIHSRFNLGRTAMTDRLLAAMDNPYLNIIGHPTGRLLMARNPYPLDFEAVLTRAAERGVALEINADPHRLDLDWRLAAMAREAGVSITIGADAHGASGLDNVALGIGMARKSWLEASQVINCQPAEAFLEWSAARRPTGAA
jgi:DNA polymerase (family 10)